MKLKSIYEKSGTKYADFTEINEIGIEFNEANNEVSEMHFDISIKIDILLEKEGFISNKEMMHYYDQEKNILTVPIIEIKKL